MTNDNLLDDSLIVPVEPESLDVGAVARAMTNPGFRHLHKSMRFFSKIVAILLLVFSCSRVGAQSPKPQQKKTPHSPSAKSPAKENGRLTPTRDPRAKSGVYIPKDLNDALKELRHMLPPDAVADMKRGTEENMGRYHMGLGVWMRNNWGLWAGSRLSKWFNAQGIRHPDDMSGILLTSLWRSLHQKPLRLEAQVKYYQAYWQQAKEAQ